MRIPTEALLYYPIENDNKTVSDTARAEPIDGAASLRATLSSPFREHPRFEEDEKVKSETERHGRNHRNSRFPYHPHHSYRPDNDRREHHDRRKQDLPVLLDTRLAGRREDPEAPPRIDLKA